MPKNNDRNGDTSQSTTSSADVGRKARWGILVVACLAQLMVVLDGTIVNIALPSAQADLGFDDHGRQWVVTAYALAFGSLLLVGGRLGDLFGRRPAFLLGLVGFAIASAVGGAAVNFGMLVVARSAQGVFGALLAPTALSLLTTTFTDPRERSRAFAIFGALSGAGGAIGLLLGGVLTEYFSWAWCLFVNVPLAVIAGIGAVALLRKPPAREQGAGGMDWAGSALSVLGFVSLVYGLANAETAGWGSGSTYGFVLLGLVMLALFVYVETRVAVPLLPLPVLLDRNRGGSFIAIALAGVGLFGVFLFMTYYLSAVLGYAPLRTGVAFLPLILGIMISAQFVPAIVGSIGVKVPVTVGFAVAGTGLLLFARLQLDSRYATGVLPGLILVGLGMGLVLAPAVSAATDRIDPRYAGVASAAVNTFQQIGGSIGTAVLSAVAATATAGYMMGRDPADPQVAAQSGLVSYVVAFVVSALFLFAGAVVSALVLRHGALERDPDVVVIAH